MSAMIGLACFMVLICAIPVLLIAAAVSKSRPRSLSRPAE